MYMSQIALLVPTRNRLNLQLTLISSIITTVKDINNVTLYFGVDRDDPTREIIYKIANAIPFVKIIDIEPKGKQTNIHEIWNKLANISTETIVSMVGDDFIFKTQNWDEKILEEFNEQNLPSDKIKSVYCWDGQRGGDLAVNIFTHREYLKYNDGKFLSETYLLNWSDQDIDVIFRALGRLKYRGDIEIFHNHYVFGGRKMDETAIRMLERDGDKSQTDLKWGPAEPERVERVLKIAKAIGVTPNFKEGKFSEKYWN
jgi:rhodanese-related sulfurtransferase